jgi:PAS domain S-box-containing protein/putative nucleotidyltransferase with HDIG domain
MTSAQVLYLLANFLSLGLSLGVAVYAYSQRQVRGTRAYVWYATGQTLWVFGFIMGLIIPSLDGKLFWENFQWFAGQFIVISFPFFAIEYTNYKLSHSKLMFRLSLIFPAIFITLAATNGLHHLVYLNPRLQTAFLFPKLDYENSTIINVFAFYSFLILSAGIALLVRQYLHTHKLYRSQIAIIVTGFFMPILGLILTLFGVFPDDFHDPTAFTTAAGNLIVAWGLYRFHIFKVTPVGRDRVFESMLDPVVILDNKHTIIDINRSMLDLLGMESASAIGQSAKVIFADFPIPIKMYTDVTYARTEAKYELGGRMVFYELSIWPLYDRDQRITGRVYISHDITALKELENELRGLNQKLEERVNMRTKELAEAYDTTLEGWALALELRDKETEGHSRRVTETTLKVARALHIPEEQLVHIRRGSILHDIGKMSIPDEILRKRGNLTEEERAIINQHPNTAQQLLERIPFLKKAMDIPYCHHEKWDGTGYPRGLQGREIPLAARVFTVVDVWDAIQSDRPYKQGWTSENACAYLREQSGKYFDPEIVAVFLRMVKEGKI